MIDININPSISLEHLIPQIRKTGLLPNEEPIAHIFSDREFSSLLVSITSTLTLKKPSFLLDKEIREYILRKTEATIGEIILLISKNAILAKETRQEKIYLNLLMQASYDFPTERRNKFERELN